MIKNLSGVCNTRQQITTIVVVGYNYWNNHTNLNAKIYRFQWLKQFYVLSSHDYSYYISGTGKEMNMILNTRYSSRVKTWPKLKVSKRITQRSKQMINNSARLRFLYQNHQGLHHLLKNGECSVMVNLNLRFMIDSCVDQAHQKHILLLLLENFTNYQTL